MERQREDRPAEAQPGTVERAGEATVVAPEARVAFYKALKFWMVFVLAVFAAALVWRFVGDATAGPDAPSPDDAERLRRGEVPFDYDVPDVVTYRDHAFVKRVEAARHKRWFAPEERPAWMAALAAWEETRRHADRLRRDHALRGAEQVAANIRAEPAFQGLHIVFRWERPYLLGYVSGKPLHEWEGAPDDETRARRRRVDLILKERGRLLTQLYAEFMRRYETRFRLKDLMAPYGGRADYPLGVRSFPDGCVLTVLTFDDPAARARVAGAGPGTLLVDAQVISPARSGWVLALDRGTATPQAHATRRAVLLEHAARQLFFWFTRQRNRWARPLPGSDTVRDGVCAILAGVRIDAALRVTFLDRHPQYLQRLREGAEVARLRGVPFPVVPVRVAVGASDVFAWAAETWRLGGEDTRRILAGQGWALACYFQYGEEGRYAARLERYLDHVLYRETSREGAGVFARAFRVLDEGDWAELDAGFERFVREVLLADADGK